LSSVRRSTVDPASLRGLAFLAMLGLGSLSAGAVGAVLVSDATGRVDVGISAARAVAETPTGPPLTLEPVTPHGPSPTSDRVTVGAVGAPPAEAKPAYVPTRHLPRDSGHGDRIVYSRHRMHVWVVDAVAGDDQVVRDYAVTGRPDWPAPGRYEVFLKTPWTMTLDATLSFRWFIGFAHGNTTNIGFHDIPTTTSGTPIQSPDELGEPIGIGGCVRATSRNAHWLYERTAIGDRVVVLP
jgi:hypothetical protein